MILNGNTGSHPLYQPDRRARAQKRSRQPSGLAAKDCPRDLEGKLAWLRGREERKAKAREAKH